MARAKGHERKKRLHAMNRHDDGPIALKSRGLGADRTKTMTRRRVSSIRHRNSFARVTAQCGKFAEEQQSRFVGLGRNSELGDPILSLLEAITMTAHSAPRCHTRYYSICQGEFDDHALAFVPSSGFLIFTTASWMDDRREFCWLKNRNRVMLSSST